MEMQLSKCLPIVIHSYAWDGYIANAIIMDVKFDKFEWNMYKLLLNPQYNGGIFQK